MNRNIYIALALALIGVGAARVLVPRFGLTGAAIGNGPASLSDRGLSPTMQSRLTGDLTLTVIEQDGNGYRVKAELKGGQFNQAPAGKTDLNAALAQPFYFTVSSSGEMSSFYFAKDLPPEARQLLKQAANSLQATIPGGRNAAWHATEKDVSGTYEADYTANGNSVIRTKSQYVQAGSLEGLAPINPDTRYAVESKTSYDLGANGWPQSVTSTEAFDVDAHGTSLVVTGRATATLASTASHPELAQAMPANQVESESAANEHVVAEQRLAFARDMVKDRTFEQIAADLEAVTKDKKPDNNLRNKAQAQLSALFLLQLGTLGAAEDAVLRGNHEANFMHRVIGAMAGADSAPAQAALVAIQQNGNEQRQMDAVAALGMVKHPTAESTAALQRLIGRSSDQVNRTATLAVGNMARRMETHQHDTAAAQQLMSGVLEQLQRSNDADAQRVALEAVGNWGDVQAFPVLQRFLAGTETTQRATAVASLRFMTGSTVDAAVTTAMNDAAPTVRRAAAETIAFRPVSGVLPAIEKMIKTEQDQQVALKVVQGLAAKQKESGTVDLLKWIAGNHPSAEVKKAAQKAIATAT